MINGKEREMRRIVILLGLLGVSLSLYGESPLKDPGIPDRETIRYAVSTGKMSDTVVQSVQTFSRDGRDFYLVNSDSDSQDIRIEILRSSLIPVKSEKNQKTGRTDLRSTSEISSVPSIGTNEVFLVDFNDLSHVLRGYPFDAPRTLDIVFPYQPQEESSSMSFRIKYIRKETLKLECGTYESYKLQLAAQMSGGMAVFAGMIPKNYFWYSVDSPHYLLKYEGGAGPDNSENIVMEMMSYTAD